MSSFAGGLVFFFWSSFAWMALNLHGSYYQSLPSDQESTIRAYLRNTISQPGLYTSPGMDQSDPNKATQMMKTGPLIFMNIHPRGINPSMGKSLFLGLVINIIVSFFLTFMLSHTRDASYWKKVRLVVMVMLAGMIIPVFANWNWWHFPSAYLFTMILDFVVGWSLAGMAITRFAPQKA